MNILFVAKFRITPNSGGVQRVTSTLASKLKDRGHSVYYIALHEGETEEIEGIVQFYLPDNNLNSAKAADFFSAFLETNKIDTIINQGGIYKHIINFVCDNNYLNIPVFTVHHNTVAGLLNNLRNIMLGGGFGKYMKFLDYPLVWKMLKYRTKKKYGSFFKNAIEKSEKLILLSEYFEPELNIYLDEWPREKVVSIPNPAPFSMQNISEQDKKNKLVYVGRIEYTQKQINILIEIWGRIYKLYPNWTLDIVGGGTKLEEVKEIIKYRKIERINFYGFKDPSSFLRQSKIFCMTSSFEGFPMVLVEAHAFKTIPIAFDAFSSIYDIIENKSTGILVPSFDIEDYVAQLRSLMDNDELLLKMQELSKSVIDKFSPDIVTSKWESLIQSSAKV